MKRDLCSHHGGGPHSHQGRWLDQHPMRSPVGSPWWCGVTAQGVTSRVSPVSPVPHKGTGLPAQPGWWGCTSASPPASHHPPAAGSWDVPWDLLGPEGRGGFLDSCALEKPTGEAPNWRLVFPRSAWPRTRAAASRCGEGSRATCQASPSPEGPQTPPKPAESCVRAWGSQELSL